MRKVRPVIRALGAAAVVVLALVVFAGDLAAQALAPEVLKAFNFRAIGPTRQSGRITDFAVPELEPWTIYTATGSGGLWKSVNNGQTWEPIFDNQPVISIGDIAVAASNPNIVYVGSGEANTSRSTYWGDGVYKSTDAGKTWTNVGLKDTHHIGRMVIHPKNPDIVYVAALGHLYSQNDERGVFKTIDGGKTWTKSLDVKADGKTVGAADIVMDPVKPEILYAATYDKERKPWTFNLAGPGSAIYKTTDAGQDVDEADRRPPGRHDRPHRPRHQPEEPAGALREHRERQQAEDVRRRPPEGAARGHVERGDDRRRGLPDRRRRQDVAEGEREEPGRRRTRATTTWTSGSTRPT